MILPYHYKSFAFRLLFAVLGLNLIGLLVINSASNHDMAIVGRQLSGAAIGITAMLVLSLLPYQKLLRYAVPLYAGCCLLLLLVIVYGRIRGGARRWIVIPGLGQLQPSEFAKIGIILFAAWLLGKNLEALNKAHFLLVFSGLLMIPVFLIASEPDLSTTIVVLVCIFSMIFVAGLSYRWIGAALAVVLPFSTSLPVVPVA